MRTCPPRFSWVFAFESKCSWVTLVGVTEYYISHESIASTVMQTRKCFTNIVTHCFFFFPRDSFKRDEYTIDRDNIHAANWEEFTRYCECMANFTCHHVNHVQSALSGVWNWLEREERHWGGRLVHSERIGEVGGMLGQNCTFGDQNPRLQERNSSFASR